MPVYKLPEGFYRALANVEGGAVVVEACDVCHAIVADPKQHVEWHERQDRSFRTLDRIAGRPVSDGSTLGDGPPDAGVGVGPAQVNCPRCGAQPGYRCTAESGRRTRYHRERIQLREEGGSTDGLGS